MDKEQQKKAELFMKAYQKLCLEYGFQLNVVPQFKSRDDGTWSIVLQATVIPATETPTN